MEREDKGRNTALMQGNGGGRGGTKKDEVNVTRGSDIRFTPLLNPGCWLGTPTD